MPIVDEGFNVLIKMDLVKTYNSLHLARRDAQINEGITNCCVLVIDDKPQAVSVENNFVEIQVFYFPVSVHSRTELFPFGLRNEKCTWIEFWVIRFSLLNIHKMVFMGEVRPFFVVVHTGVHIAPSN